MDSGHTLVQSSLVCRFNLKHKQRPDPSKKNKTKNKQNKKEASNENTSREAPAQYKYIKMEFFEKEAEHFKVDNCVNLCFKPNFGM